MSSAIDAVESDLLGVIGIAMTGGSIVRLDWQERWLLDVQRYLTSREIDEILDEESTGKPRSEVGLKRHTAKGTKGKGKRRTRLLKKLGLYEEYQQLTKKSGAV